MPITTAVFDAYGTLFDVTAAARKAAQEPGFESLARVWPQLASDWRLKQLQYTWLRAITGQHTSFWQVTQDGLDWAMEASKLTDPKMRNRLLALYRELAAYPEVPQMLDDLKSKGIKTAILSNGSMDMLSAAVASARIGSSLDAVLSVDEVEIFKPARQVYDLVGQHFDTEPKDVLFVSSNGWDAAGAAGYGFQTVWVNRAQDPIDRLPAIPHHILGDLTTIPTLAGSL